MAIHRSALAAQAWLALLSSEGIPFSHSPHTENETELRIVGGSRRPLPHVNAAISNLMFISPRHCDVHCLLVLLAPKNVSSPPLPHLERVMVLGPETGSEKMVGRTNFFLRHFSRCLPRTTMSSTAPAFSGRNAMVILPGFFVGLGFNLTEHSVGDRVQDCRLQLLSLFNCFSRYSCKVPLSIPMRGGFYTSKFSLYCSHTSSDTNITLGSDWISAYSTMMDPRCKTRPSLPFLPASHYWSPSENPHEGMTTAHRALSGLTCVSCRRTKTR